MGPGLKGWEVRVLRASSWQPRSPAWREASPSASISSLVQQQLAMGDKARAVFSPPISPNLAVPNVEHFAAVDLEVS